MKKHVYFMVIVIGLLIGCTNSDDDLGLDEVELSKFIIENYTEDAKQLYFNEVFNDQNHSNYSKEQLDLNEINEILKIIQTVYNSNSPERDLVFDTYNIHAFLCYSFNAIGLKVNTELDEIKNLSEGKIPTGNNDLDELLTLYNFDSVKKAYSYPNFPWLTIYSAKEYNLLPIEKAFKEIVGVSNAEFNKGCIGDGNNISLERNNGNAIITFSIGSGDCPSGCIYRKYWEFSVTKGTAKFLRSYEN